MKVNQKLIGTRANVIPLTNDHNFFPAPKIICFRLPGNEQILHINTVQRKRNNVLIYKEDRHRLDQESTMKSRFSMKNHHFGTLTLASHKLPAFEKPLPQ